ncbi:hypothetical protein SBRCBS47491_005219 [Sporothrix bragantina]|uniref:DUF7053 domain-containing protein n=1 Tax=Sporothrix bragantina TaxID=671064 RepID=A0ABP0BUT7_9PEZI
MPFLTFHLAYALPANCPPQRVVDALHRYEPLITPNPYLVSFRRRPVEIAEIVDDPFFREDGYALAAFEVTDRIVLVPGVATKQVVIPCVMQRFEGGVRCRSLAAGGVRVWSTWKVVPAGQPGGGGDGATATIDAAAPSKKRRSSSRSSSRDDSRRSHSNNPPLPSSQQASPLPQPAVVAATASTAPTPPATPPTTNAFPESGEGYEIVEEARVECGSLVKPFVGRSFKEGHIEILRQVVQGVLLQMEREKMSYVYM